MSITVKKWFLDKNFSRNEAYAITTCRTAEIVKETEKAALIRFDTDSGTIQSWIPKAAMQVEELRPAAAEAVEFSVGDKVLHQTFGEGVVLSVDEGTVTVKFGKVKKLIMDRFLERA